MARTFREWLRLFCPVPHMTRARQHQIEQLALATNWETSKLADKLETIGRTSDPLAELVRQVKSASRRRGA